MCVCMQQSSGHQDCPHASSATERDKQTDERGGETGVCCTQGVGVKRDIVQDLVLSVDRATPSTGSAIIPRPGARSRYAGAGLRPGEARRRLHRARR
ncbi:hypothetical protein VTN02DRAFT_4303 [Thermoascus thermophilus]